MYTGGPPSGPSTVATSHYFRKTRKIAFRLGVSLSATLLSRVRVTRPEIVSLSLALDLPAAKNGRNTAVRRLPETLYLPLWTLTWTLEPLGTVEKETPFLGMGMVLYVPPRRPRSTRWIWTWLRVTDGSELGTLVLSATLRQLRAGPTEERTAWRQS